MSNSTLILLDGAFDEYKKTLPDDIKNSDIGVQFDYFAASLIHRDQSWSFDELASGIVDGADDEYIDAAHLIVNGTLIKNEDDLPNISRGGVINLTLIQAKHEAKVTVAELTKLAAVIGEMLSLGQTKAAQEKSYNLPLANILALFRQAVKQFGIHYELNISVLLACRGPKQSAEADKRINRKLDLIVQNIENELPSVNANAKVFAAADLHRISASQVAQRFDLEIRGDDFIRKNPGPSYVGLVKLRSFIEFIIEGSELNQGLFEFNVRDFEGDRAIVNSAIAKTIENPDANTDFWWFNNGVTILADEVDSNDPDKLDILGPKIVNGLQTSNVLFNSRGSIDESDERRVLVKIVQTQDEVVQNAVITATNSQTRLKAYAVIVASERHKEIEQHLKKEKLYYERRKNYYKSRGKKADTIVDPLRLAQTLLSMKIGAPHTARGRPGNAFKDTKTYKAIFQDDGPAEDFINAAKLERKVNTYWRTLRKSYGSEYTNNLRWHTLMILFWRIGGGRKKAKLHALDTSKVTDEEILKYFKFVKTVFDKKDPTNKRAGSEAFTKQLRKAYDAKYKKKLKKPKAVAKGS